MKELEFEAVYKEYYTKVYFYVYKKLSNYHETEDIVHKVFVKCFENIKSYDESRASISTWLFTIVNNTLKNYYRDKKNHISIEEFMLSKDISDSNEDMEQAIELEEMRKLLNAALNDLDDYQKEIVIMRYFKEMSNREIAQKLGYTEGNVRVILSRTLKKMNQYFEKNNIEWEF